MALMRGVVSAFLAALCVWVTVAAAGEDASIAPRERFVAKKSDTTFAVVPVSSLAEVFASGDADAVKKAFAAGVDPNAVVPGANGLTPLLLAAANNSDPEAIQAILEAGADLESVDPYRGYTALHLAVVFNLFPNEATKILLNAGMNPYATDVAGKTVLEMSLLSRPMEYPNIRLLRDEEETFTSLFAACGGFSFTPADGDTEAYWSRILYGYLYSKLYENFIGSRGPDAAILQRLFDAGADVNRVIPDRIPGTILGLCVTVVWRDGRNMDLVECVLGHGADPNLYGPQCEPALFLASMVPSALLVQQLLRAGAKVDAVDNQGHGILHRYLESFKGLLPKLTMDAEWLNEFEEVLTLLLEAGTDPRQVGRLGETPLHLFLDNLKIGPPIETVGNISLATGVEKDTALRIIRKLVEFGADLQAKDAGGNAPLNLLMPTRDGLALLKELGCDVNARDAKERTMLIRVVAAIAEAAKRSEVHPVYKDDKGRTISSYYVPMSLPRHVAQLDALLEAGADPEIRDADGKKAIDYLSPHAVDLLQPHLDGHRWARHFLRPFLFGDSEESLLFPFRD